MHLHIGSLVLGRKNNGLCQFSVEITHCVMNYWFFHKKTIKQLPSAKVNTLLSKKGNLRPINRFNSSNELNCLTNAQMNTD
jgi:hypothetical protein